MRQEILKAVKFLLCHVRMYVERPLIAVNIAVKHLAILVLARRVSR